MRTHTVATLTLSLSVAVPFGLCAQEQGATDARYEAAVTWVNLVVEGDYESAAEQVNAAGASQMGAAQLEQAWTQLGPQLGELNSLTPQEQSMQQGFHMVVLTGVFSAGTFDVQVFMADDHTVAGFFVRPPGG